MHRHQQATSYAERTGGLPESGCRSRIILDVREVQSGLLERNPADPRSLMRLSREDLVHELEPFPSGGVVGDQIDDATVQTEDNSGRGTAKYRGTPCDGVEHRLHIRWRAADDSQDLARSSLLLQRFG